MKNYQIAIETAVIIFPIIAFLITLPYMIKQYRKYGSIPLLRTVIVYSFVLYLLTAYFMVILPLPSISEVVTYTKPWTQLVPFNFVDEIISYSGIVINDIDTYLPALKNPVIYMNLFNLVLTVPFGIYLRYYFKRKWWEVVLFTSLLSLFFEVTQLSGLYGIYPRPYRLFDVDDLIINTTGGLLGYLITPLFSFALPTRKRLDETAYERGKRVSFSRRVMAFLIDTVIFNGIMVIILSVTRPKIFGELYCLCYLSYFLISVVIFRGSTIGKKVVKIKIVSQNDQKAKIYQLWFRYLVMYIIFYKIYDIIDWGLSLDHSNLTSMISVILYMLLFFIYIKTLFDVVTKKERFFYEKLSKTKNISTINYVKGEEKINQEEKEELEEKNEKKILQ